MYPEVERRLDELVVSSRPSVLEGRRVGLERETLRVDDSGVIALSDHPAALGSALAHSAITTDFSEALLEMVTPPEASTRAALDTLEDVHRFVAARLENDETFWSASMPCVLHGDDSIRIGEYGHSHPGRMKQVYRRGLGVRYGRRMQAIAGIHFNFSLPASAWTWRSGDASAASQSDGYFSMMQNLVAIGWLVPFLFGASPAICRTFLGEGQDSDLAYLGEATRFAPYGTSLRMGNIGYRYREDAKIDLSVDHRTLHGWVRDVIGHVSTSHPDYARLGVFDASGERQQLSDARLQIENEYYGTVRPKQIPEPGEMPILALHRRGIRYLELRSLDIDPFQPSGLSLQTLAVLELLMLFAWLAEPQPLSGADLLRIKDNMKQVAHRGREPGLQLQRRDGEVALTDWARAILAPLEPLAEWLDAARPVDDALYVPALQQQLSAVDDTATLPSARVLDAVRDAESFAEFTAAQSLAHHEYLTERGPDAVRERALEQEVAASRQRQCELETGSHGSLEAYLADYFAQLSDAADAVARS